MIREKERDIIKDNEACSKKGIRSYIGFSGQMAYYCTQYCENLMAIFVALGMS